MTQRFRTSQCPAVGFTRRRGRNTTARPSRSVPRAQTVGSIYCAPRAGSLFTSNVHQAAPWRLQRLHSGRRLCLAPQLAGGEGFAERPAPGSLRARSDGANFVGVPQCRGSDFECVARLLRCSVVACARSPTRLRRAASGGHSCGQRDRGGGLHSRAKGGAWRRQADGQKRATGRTTGCAHNGEQEHNRARAKLQSSKYEPQKNKRRRRARARAS